MELNRKSFLGVLSLIKACKDVILIKDSPVKNCLDILYCPNCADDTPLCVNKITIPIGGSGTDLFDDDPVESLGKPIPLFLSRVKNVLREAQSCILENGCINGVRVAVDDSSASYGMYAYISDLYDNYSAEMPYNQLCESVVLRKADYAYIVSECAKFVSKDSYRYHITGICVDFTKVGSNAVHFVATDGKKLCLLKHAVSCLEYSADLEPCQFIIPPAYLFVPDSEYTSVQIRLARRSGQILLSAADYQFEGLFKCIEGKFPNYDKVIPVITEKTEWFTLCAASFRIALNSVKSLMKGNSKIYLNAENPENLTITVAGGQQTLAIVGTASRPMKASFLWEQLSPCLFDGRALTKFYLDSADKAFLAHESKAVKGLSLDVTKVFMPTQDEGNSAGLDEFRIPLPEKSGKDGVSASSSDVSVNEQEYDSL
jgi:hypothetical protein